MSAVLSVLLVDDHKIFRLGMAGTLKAIPGVKQIAEAENGLKALEYIRKHHVDLVFMDIRMPVMNGMEATAALQKEFPKVKVIALTMFNDQEFLSEMFGNGAAGYLLKNTDAEEIKEAIETVMAGDHYFSREITESILNHLLSKQQAPRYLDGGYVPTDREKQVLSLICDGHNTREIAEKLGISPRTVEGHRARLLYKSHCRNVAELVQFALKNKLR